MLKIEDNGITVVKFGAEWCAPCKMINVVLDKMKEEFDNITFASVDVDDDPELAKQYKISNLPTVILFKDGCIVDKVVGAVKTEPLRKKFRELSAA